MADGTKRDGTRSRILEAAWTLVRERGSDAVTIAEIAAAAGVSRQLVYLYFDHRAGLLLAMARRHDARSGFAQRVNEALSEELPPVRGLETLLRAWFGYIPQILPVARALEAAAIAGDEAGVAWQDRMRDLWEAFRAAIDRVELQGRLAPGWTVPTATDWVWARSHIATWEHLVGDRGWTPEDFTERTVASILGEVVTRVRRPASPARAAPGPR